MTSTEKTELALIATATVAVKFFEPALPDALQLGNLVVILSAVLFGQSLLRDLWILSRKQRAAAAQEKRTLMCMCAETTVGTLGMVIGVLLLGLASERVVPLPAWSWTACLGGTMAACFLMKDYVIHTRPWGIRRDPDHMNIIVGRQR